MAGYREIAELLQQHYRSGEYPERKYPSLRKIADDMGCSYMTAVRAMRFLQEKESVQSPHSFPLVAMITSMWRFNAWCGAIRESVMELGGQLRFVTYSSFIDPVITETLNEKFDLVILDCPVEPESPLFNVVRKHKDHVVLLFQNLTKYGIRCMDGIPNETVILIMEDLARHGVRHIDMIERAMSGTSASRMDMWKTGLQRINGHGKVYCYPHTSFSDESAECYEYLKETLDAEKLPEAFFCSASGCAQGLYRYLYDLGLVPGKDISVFSFGGAKSAEMMTPPLATAINVGLKEMVESVVSEYVHHKKSSRMMFRLTQQVYYQGNSLVPFRQKNGKDLSIEQNIRCGEDKE